MVQVAAKLIIAQLVIALSYVLSGFYASDLGLVIAFPFAINYTMDLISELKKAKGPVRLGGLLLLVVSIPVNIFGAIMFVGVLSFLIWQALGVVNF